MKIDLHTHTKAVKKGDPETRNVTAENFKEAVKNAGVKIVAITNHNVFDNDQYNLFLKEVNKDFLVWPGIELDVKGIDGEVGHIVIVSNPRDIENFKLKTEEITKDTLPNSFVIDIEDAINYINSIDCIAMVHYNKAKALHDASINLLKSKICDAYRLFYEPSKYRTMGIMINHEYYSVMGSDVKDWDKYCDYEFSDLKLNVDSFEQFLMLAKKDPAIIETLYKSQNKNVINIGFSDTENVDFYDDINIVFGTKGTGKSILLGKVKSYFDSKGKNVSYYEPSKTPDKINSKLDVNDTERSLSRYGKDNKLNEFQFLKNWKEESVTQFKDYTNYISSKNGNANKERMKILEVTEITNNCIKKLSDSFEKLANVKKILELNEKIEISEYLTEEELKTINTIYNNVLSKVKEETISIWENKISVYLSNKTVNCYKKSVEANTNLKTLPSTTGFTKYVKNRFELERKVNSLISGFNYEFEESTISLGMLEEGKELKLVTTINMLNKNSKTQEFKKGIKVLQELKKNLDDIALKIYSQDLADLINDFSEKLNNSSICSLDDFIGIIKKFKIGDDEYTPSTGEATMIILDEALNDNYDVYILDEPEKSLGNAYVNDVLVPKINSLAKLKKTVIIATHNANIAVRTFPLRSILKDYKNSQYRTYVGSPYSNTLKNVNNEEDIKDWKKESIKILEGGKDAFEERGEIYES